MAKSKVSNEIRMLRFMNNEVTQQALAEAVGVSRQTIVAIEKGNSSPSLELAFKLARVFDKTLDEVFSYDENDKK